MIELRIGDGGDGAVMSRTLGLMADAVRDLSEVWWEVVKPWAEQHFQRQFDTGGEHGGRPWVGYGNEPRYAAAKKSMVGHNRLLRWAPGTREQLAPSLMDLGSGGGIFEVTSSSVTIGTSVDHAADIERATTGPRWSGSEPSPPRIIMTATDPQKRALITRIHRAIKQRLAAMGVHIGDARVNL